jgi:hypothetical protein
MPFQPFTMPATSAETMQPGKQLMDQLMEMQKFKEALAQQQQKTQQGAIDTKYYEKKSLAELATEAAKAPHMKAQDTESYAHSGLLREQAKWFGPTAKSDIDYRAAQTQELPKETEAKLIAAKAREGISNYYNNPGTQISRILNNPALQSLVATNPDVRKNIGNILSAATARAAGNKEAPVLNEKDYAALGDTLANISLKKGTTANIQNQRHYAALLDGIFDEGAKLMPAVSQYVGLARKGKKGLDAMKSTFGSTSKEYSDYLKFTRVNVKLQANEMLRALGKNATDQQSKEMDEIANPDFWDSNPQQAMDQYNYLMHMYKDVINKNLAKSSSQTIGDLAGNGSQSSQDPYSALSDEELDAKIAALEGD